MARYYPDRIKLARESREFSQVNFAELCGISQANLSKIEKGLKIPSEEEVKAFSNILKYPMSFFEKDSTIHPYLKEFYYRRTLNIAQKKLDSFEAQINIISEHIETLLEAIDLKTDLPSVNIENEEISPERLAQKIRIHFGVAKGSIRDLISTLEQAGIIILYFQFPASGKLDGVSFITKKGYPVILINRNSSNSRIIFTLAHELGHLIMHYSYLIADKRDIEKEANQFATEFLAPSNEIKSDLIYLNANKLMELKLYWKMSIKALLYKAKTLGTMSEDQYRRWMTTYNMKRWSAGEPVEFDISTPRLLSRIFELHFTTLQYSKQELLNILNLNEQDLLELYDLDIIKKHFVLPGRKIKLIL